MQLLIRVIDRPDQDRRLRCGRFHRGDIIAAMPDDHEWSRRERRNRHWRILKIPSLTQAEVDALLSPELDPGGTKAFVWKRRIRLDIDAPTLPARIANYLADGTRSQIALPITEAGELALIRSLVVIKEDADT